MQIMYLTTPAMRCFILLFCSLLISACTPISAQKNSSLPEDYQLLFEEDFEEDARLSDFEMTDPAAWRLSKKDGNTALELFGSESISGACAIPS